MGLIAQEQREDNFRNIIRQLLDARKTAGTLGLGDIDKLLEMVLIGVIAEWDGIDLEDMSDAKLEAVARMRLREVGEWRPTAQIHALAAKRAETVRNHTTATEKTLAD